MQESTFFIIRIIVELVIFIMVISFISKFIKRRRILNADLKVIDKMTGQEFEEYLVVLFNQLGYKSSKTKGSGDFGVDLILKKDGKVIAIQAKRYRQKVNLKAVQEVTAGRNYYGATEAWCVTNSYYMDSAKQLAIPNHVQLIGRNELTELMKQAKNKSNVTLANN